MIKKGQTQFRTEFSRETWEQKYQWKDEVDVNDSHLRTAIQLAEPEKDKEKWIQEFIDVQENFKFLTGGRILSNAGIDRQTTLINCFHGDTEVITRFGIKKIRDIAEQDNILLTKNGQWINAPIKRFGRQVVSRITIQKNRSKKTILATPEHRWFVYSKENIDPVEIVTKDLKPGHRLEQVKSKTIMSCKLSPIGVAQGFTYGDGCGNQDHTSSCGANFCGEKDKELKKYFPEISNFGEYDGYSRCLSLPNSWRLLPSLEENGSFLYSWLAGYFAADGCVSESGECTIASTDQNNILFVKSLCSILGIRYFGDKIQDRVSNLTKKQSILYSLCLDSKDIPEEFFILKEHKSRFKNNIRTRSYHWNVVSVEDTDELHWVYCAIVQEKHSFALEGNILTGNCFVDGAEGKDIDSIEGIYTALKKQALILKSEGGYGMSADFMRPHGAYINGIANQSPGAVKFLELWDKSSEIITLGAEKKSSRKDQKNFIRKGAQMVTMSCWHPDVLRFIEAKKTPGKLTKFNMSVLCTDVFMTAVVNNKPWKLVYPNYEKFPDDYKEKWNGDLQGWIQHIGEKYNSTAGAVITYHKFDDANELWNLIMENTYNRNEPGVLFVDTMNRMNNLWYCEWINATNPCGEQVLPIGAVCLLGSINLLMMLKEDQFDFDLFKKTIHIAVRMLDNVNDVTYVPLQSQRDNLKNKRRIGLGNLGYGSALMVMKLRYGSKEALEFTERLMHFMANEAYRASALLAKEKGAFPLYDEEKYLQGEFIKNLDSDVVDLIKKYGIRNSHLISLQPTGNSSCLANIVTGGLEPNFNVPGYYRTAAQPYAPRGLNMPGDVDWNLCIHKDPSNSEDEDVWHWTKEGDEDILRTEFGGKIWKFDRNRGLTKEEWIEDHSIAILKERGEWDQNADWACSAMNLSVDDHVNTMAIFAKWADSAISKTVNLPNNYPYEDFKDVYLKAWKAGVKGFTTYREGTMTSVLSTKSSGTPKGLIKTVAPVRPERLPCDIHHISYKGEKWVVLVGVYKNDPYEVFAFRLNKYSIPDDIEKGILRKVLFKTRSRYDLEAGDHIEFKDVAKCFETDEEESLTRMISTCLRHGAEIEFVIDQLLKSKGTIASFNKVIARVLKKYLSDKFKVLKCTECKSNNLEMREGCFVCKDCGMSKCE